MHILGTESRSCRGAETPGLSLTCAATSGNINHCSSGCSPTNNRSLARKEVYVNKAIIKSVGLLGLLFCLGAVGVTAMLQSTSASPEQGSPWARYQLTGSGREGVDAVSAGDAWTVGSDGLLAHWNGTAWQAYDNSKLGTYSLYSVDMLTGSQAWATAGSGRILRYDGTDWALEPTNL